MILAGALMRDHLATLLDDGVLIGGKKVVADTIVEIAHRSVPRIVRRN